MSYRRSRFDWMHYGIMAVIFLIVGGLAYGIWYEATFDYTKCDATDQYRDRHTAAWTQIMPGTNGMPGTTIFHPARDWTERLYSCPENERRSVMFDKWRNERRP